MSKRHVAYVKPDEPSFLKKLKQQAGYKEGPTVDTKRENLDTATDDDLEDTEEEQPTVVVLKPGDLTAEEAAQETERLRKETEEVPADLNTKIVFKAPNKSKSSEKLEEKSSSKRKKNSEAKHSKKLKNKQLLSFDDEEEGC